MASPEVVASGPEARSRSVRGYIVFAFAVGLVLAIGLLHARDSDAALCQRSVRCRLHTPDRGIMRLHVMRWHPSRGLAIFFLLVSVGGATTLFFAFALPPVLHDLQVVDFASCPPAAPNCSSR